MDAIKIVKSAGNGALDSEALRVIQLMRLFPYWTPGKQQDKAVAVYFTIPITFRLDDSEPAGDTLTQAAPADISKLAANLMRIVNDGPEHYFVFWAPAQYWSVALRASGQLPEDFIQAAERELQPYSIFWLSQYRLGSLGKLIADDEAAVRREFALHDAHGRPVQPLRREEMSPALQQMLEHLKPVFSAMLGDFGKGIQFVVVRNEDVQGRRILDPKATGGFSVDFFGKQFHYQTPVPALLPPKFCPQDHARMEGDWLYCPYHGARLE